MTSNWKDVPTTTKDVLWATLKEKFTFHEGQEESARKFVEGHLERCFRNWRSTLNKEHVQKGKNAREDFGRIPQEMWEEFIQQKNTPEAKAQSEQNTKKAMKAAENSHHLGAGGYAAKIAKWRREEKEWRIAGLPDLFEGLDERSRNWVLACDSKVKFKHPTTDEIYARLEQLTERQKKGLFKPDREKDQLTTAIGTTKHSGHVQGMSSTLPWGNAFHNDQASYRKRDRYKKNHEEHMREIAKANPIVSDDQQQEEPTMQLAHTGFIALSSAGSIANVRYPVDDIQVQVVTVLDESCEIDIPTDEGIEVLDDAMNQYIL
uniref:Transposase Tnp1/En/Spm-like domain-containing protein n=1 Tax=Setaria italica TaxID=4555 RepID=K4AIJ4_SETIT